MLVALVTHSYGQGIVAEFAFPDGKLMLMDGGGIPAFGRRVKSKSI